MEESNTVAVENHLEGINLQPIVSACQGQRQDMIPQDQLQKIQWALYKEFNRDPKT